MRERSGGGFAGCSGHRSRVAADRRRIPRRRPRVIDPPVRPSTARCRASRARYRTKTLRCRISDVRWRGSDVRCRSSDVRRRQYSSRCRPSEMRHRQFSLRWRMENCRDRTSDVRHRNVRVRDRMKHCRHRKSEVRSRKFSVRPRMEICRHRMSEVRRRTYVVQWLEGRGARRAPRPGPNRGVGEPCRRRHACRSALSRDDVESTACETDENSTLTPVSHIGGAITRIPGVAPYEKLSASHVGLAMAHLLGATASREGCASSFHARECAIGKQSARIVVHRR